LYKVGALAGKFLPPHIGHLELIAQAGQQCEELIVVMAENPADAQKLCERDGFKYIQPEVRLRWLREHFQRQGHIQFEFFDETGIPAFPDVGAWSKQFKDFIGKPIDVKFIGEARYIEMNKKHFPESAIVMVERGIDSPEISATEVRQDPAGYIDFIIPEARNYFEKGGE